jgi:glycerol-3-phosphate dehydrogenase
MKLRSGSAYWPIKNGLLATYPPLEQNETCDVAIIGGGITGSLARSARMTFLHLATAVTESP